MYNQPHIVDSKKEEKKVLYCAFERVFWPFSTAHAKCLIDLITLHLQALSSNELYNKDLVKSGGKKGINQLFIRKLATCPLYVSLIWHYM